MLETNAWLEIQSSGWIYKVWCDSICFGCSISLLELKSIRLDNLQNYFCKVFCVWDGTMWLCHQVMLTAEFRCYAGNTWKVDDPCHFSQILSELGLPLSFTVSISPNIFIFSSLKLVFYRSTPIQCHVCFWFGFMVCSLLSSFCSNGGWKTNLPPPTGLDCLLFRNFVPGFLLCDFLALMWL